MSGRWWCGVVMALTLWCTAAVHADETDQFTLPERNSFADIGPFFSASHYDVLKRVVDRLNTSIDRHVLIDDETTRAARIGPFHEPSKIADMVRFEFGAGLFEMRVLESVVHSRKLKDKYGDKRTGYRTMGWVYQNVHLPFDPRKFLLLFVSSTINVYGHYFGADKFGHFHDLGHIYYKDYLVLRKNGKTDEEATAIVVKRFSRGPISEAAIIGSIATGVQSNGDLVSNYCGFKFYRNLTEPVTIDGRTLEPMLIRIGDYWAINEHVRRDSDFFEPFVSDHWNEALNPNVYEWSMRGTIRKHLQKHAADIRAFYTDECGRERSAEDFRRIEEELSTFFGEDYGYMRFSEEKMVTITNSCFGEAAAESSDEKNPTAASGGR